MDLRLNRIKGFALLAGVAVAFALIGIAVAPQSRGGLPSVDEAREGTCADLAREIDPLKVPVDSGYDQQHDIVYAHYSGRTYVLRPDDPVCATLAPARAVRAHAIDAHRQNMWVACAEIRKDLDTGPPELRARAFNKEAAEKFLAGQCEAARP